MLALQVPRASSTEQKPVALGSVQVMSKRRCFSKRVYYNQKAGWEVEEYEGTLFLQQRDGLPAPGAGRERTFCNVKGVPEAPLGVLGNSGGERSLRAQV